MRKRSERGPTVGPKAHDLARFSDADLLRELLRRDTDRPEPLKAEFLSCEVCKHFNVWPERFGDPPPDFNPCGLGRSMHFKVPDVIDDPESGYFMPRCRDRAVRSEEAPS